MDIGQHYHQQPVLVHYGTTGWVKIFIILIQIGTPFLKFDVYGVKFEKKNYTKREIAKLVFQVHLMPYNSRLFVKISRFKIVVSVH